jgi:hypothetical protein
MTGYTVSGLTNYVQTNQDLLIKDVVFAGLAGATIPNLTKQLDVKTKERLNYLNVDPVLQEASDCGFNPQGGTVFTDRDIETAQFKVNDQFCEEKLLGKYTEYKVRISAEEDPMPFEAEIMNGYVKGVNKKMEEMVWQGDKSNTARTDLINGFITIAKGADSASTITGATASGASAYEVIKTALALIPDDILDEAIIFVSPATFRSYCQDLVSANLYHYSGEEDTRKDMFIPGSSVKVHKTMGLKGFNGAYASTYSNMVYACDMVNAKEIVDVWYSKDDDLYKLKMRWNAGVCTYFPDMVVVVDKPTE